jgi:glutamine amidotransferase
VCLLALFVHSYHPVPADSSLIMATTDYGSDFPSICGQDNIVGIQFHPEKSQRMGLTLLRTLGEEGMLLAIE